MSETKTEERRLAEEQFAMVRAQLIATGATVLTPTAEWLALRKKMLELSRKLK